MKAKDDTGQLIELLTKAIVFLYKGDGTKPGLVISYLPFEDRYYVSVVRYNIPQFHRKGLVGNPEAPTPKVVVYKTHTTTIREALNDIACWVSQQKEKRNPIEKLECYINGGSGWK